MRILAYKARRIVLRGKKSKALTQKQIDALVKLSNLLGYDFPVGISKRANPKSAANKILLKWSQEWGKVKLKQASTPPRTPKE